MKINTLEIKLKSLFLMLALYFSCVFTAKAHVSNKGASNSISEIRAETYRFDSMGTPSLLVKDNNFVGLSKDFAVDPPRITSLSAVSAEVGSSITISGSDFSSTLANNQVYFGATKATITAASSTSLTVTIPKGATYGYVTVLNTEIRKIAHSPIPFSPKKSTTRTTIRETDFKSPVKFTSGVKPGYLAIADIDGDGKPDYVANSSDANSVSVFRNNSLDNSPSFATPLTFSTGDAPQGVTFADLNNDGKLDMIVACYNTNSLSVFINTSTLGNISFRTKVEVDVGSCPFFVVATDVDGDGLADLVTADKDGNRITVLLNQGDVCEVATFAYGVGISVGSMPYSLAASDFDGDGKPDIAVAVYGASKVSVLRNTSVWGTVSFADAVDITVTTPYGINVGDLDGDGKIDIATANLTLNSLSTFRNLSTPGNISFSDPQFLQTDSKVYNVAVADIDGDGKLDLTTAAYETNKILVFKNQSVSGNISYSAPTSIASEGNPSYVVVGDLNGDNFPDLLAANYTTNTISVINYLPKTLIATYSPYVLSGTYGLGSGTVALQLTSQNLSGNVTVTPPLGYEYTSNISDVGSFGENGKPVIVAINSGGFMPGAIRLSKTADVGTYSGNFVISHPEVDDVLVSVPESTISKTPITIIAPNNVRSYGTVLSSETVTKITVYGLRGQDNIGSVTISYKTELGSGNNPNDPIGDYNGAILVSAATGGTFNPNNYDITYQSGNLMVVRAQITVKANNVTRPYGSVLKNGEISTEYIVTGLVNGETITTAVINYEEGEGNGNHPLDAVRTFSRKVSISGPYTGTFKADNYSITFVKGDLTVAKAPLTIRAINASKTYGSVLSASNNSNAFIATGLANSETIGSVRLDYASGAGNGNEASDGVGEYTGKVIPYYASGGTFKANNYRIQYSSGDLLVTKAPLTIKASDANRMYGSVLQASTSTKFTAQGLVNSETIASVDISYFAGAGNGNNASDGVGVYEGKVVPSNATGGTFNANNYDIQYSLGNLSVTKAPLTIKASDASRMYGTELQATSSTKFTTQGLVNSETIASVDISYSTGAGNGNSASDGVGVYVGKVIPSNATGGNFNANNYEIQYSLGDLSVTKAPLIIKADNKAREFGTPDPLFTASYDGFKNGETASILSTAPQFSTTATLNSPAGTYSIVPFGAIASNYEMSYVNGVMMVIRTINTAPTLNPISSTTLCASAATQQIMLSGITAGTETNQTTVLSVQSDKPELFSNLTVGTRIGNTAILSFYPKVGASGTAQVTVTVKDNGGVENGGTDTFSRTFSITLNALPEIVINSDLGTEISLGLTTRLIATGGVSYQWSNSRGIISGQNSSVLTVRPLENTTYTVTVKNASGCTSTKSITILVKEDYRALKYNNLVTPNGDGINDTWVVENIDAYPNNLVKVFNERGQELFSKRGYTNTWNFTHNGATLAKGTYYYVVDFGAGKPSVKGYITVL